MTVRAVLILRLLLRLRPCRVESPKREGTVNSLKIFCGPGATMQHADRMLLGCGRVLVLLTLALTLPLPPRACGSRS